MRIASFLAAFGTLTALATSPLAAAKEQMPWFIYRDGGNPDNHGTWQAVQAPGSSAAIILDDTAAPAEGVSDVRLEFTLRPPVGWAGIVVLPYPNAWGIEPGFAYDLSSARHLAFKARGASGGEKIRIKAAVAGDQPFGDSSPLPFDSGWLTLSDQWQSFELEVDGGRLSRVITPLVVISSYSQNPVGRAIVHLDHIRYELGPATRLK